MGKKTRIKLVGEGWDKNSNKNLSNDFGNHKVGDIIEVEFEEPDRVGSFKYNGVGGWVYYEPSFAIEILPDEPAPISEPEKPFEFRVGDKVKVPWSDKVFELIDSEGFIGFIGNDYPLALDDGIKNVYTVFTLDGKQSKAHDKPILTLVERPKKTVQKTYWVATWFIDNVKWSDWNKDINELKRVYSDHKKVQFHEITREENE